MRKPVAALLISDEQRAVLTRISRSTVEQHRNVLRAKALLAAVQGRANTAIGAELGVSPATVASWRARFATDGVNNFGAVRAGRGRKAVIDATVFDRIVFLTLNTHPEGETHWSTRTMAATVGVSKTTVHRVWTDLGFKPHLVSTFKVSTDPAFESKLVDVVGLYLDPP